MRHIRGEAQRQRRSWSVRSLAVVTLTAALTLAAGCTRRFYRENADADVVGTLTQKNKYDPWAVEQWHVYPDPRARYADPNNPDRPPMPPDDPSARLLSPNPQKPGKAGVGLPYGFGWLEYLTQWDAENRAAALAREKERREREAATRPGRSDGKSADGPEAKPSTDGPLVPTAGEERAEQEAGQEA